MIRVFVGCAANNEDLESMMVLEHSIRSRTKVDVEITWMRLSRDHRSPFYSDGPRGWQTRTWSTPFSGFRWAVPELAGFKGRAIYLDSDEIVLADINQLWKQPFEPGRIVLAKGKHDSWRFCVSVWDCEAAKAYLPSRACLGADPDAHQVATAYFKAHSELVQPFKGNWNCIDGEDYFDLSNEDVKIIHYSSEAHQPHLRHAVPRLNREGKKHWFEGRMFPHWRPDLIQIFESEYQGALRSGYEPLDYATPDYGPYIKRSTKNYSSNRWAPG